MANGEKRFVRPTSPSTRGPWESLASPDYSRTGPETERKVYMQFDTRGSGTPGQCLSVLRISLPYRISRSLQAGWRTLSSVS